MKIDRKSLLYQVFELTFYWLVFAVFFQFQGSWFWVITFVNAIAMITIITREKILKKERIDLTIINPKWRRIWDITQIFAAITLLIYHLSYGGIITMIAFVIAILFIIRELIIMQKKIVH